MPRCYLVKSNTLAFLTQQPTLLRNKFPNVLKYFIKFTYLLIYATNAILLSPNQLLICSDLQAQGIQELDLPKNG